MTPIISPKLMLSAAILLNSALATPNPNLHLDTRASSSCTNYTASRESYSQTGLVTSIVSAGLVCPSTQTIGCKLPSGGWVTDSRTLNITTSDASSIFTLISSAVDYQFNETESYDVDVYTFTFRNGTAGYIGWTFTHHCTSGVLSGCSGDISDGTAVEACGPMHGYTGSSGLAGSIGPIYTDDELAESVTCNPANTTKASKAPDEACLSGNSSSSSDSSGETSGAGLRTWWGDSVGLGLVCAGVLAFGGAAF